MNIRPFFQAGERAAQAGAALLALAGTLPAAVRTVGAAAKNKRLPLSLAALLLLVLGMLAPTASAVNTPSWTSSGPIGRWGHSAILDPTTNRMVEFGGNVASANTNLPFQDLNDLWRLSNVGGSGLSWTQVRASGTPPAPRVAHTAVYDAGSNRMIVFGGALGNASPCANDVWVLTNANGNGGIPAWIQLSPAGSPPAARLEHGAAYDPNTNTMIVFGGNNCFSTDFGDVSVLSNANGVGGTPTWSQLSPSGGGPGPRGRAKGVAYDATNNRLMVFGGEDASGILHNDTWVLSNANGQGGTPAWTLLSPSGSLPPARADNSTTYDPSSNRLTIFGGFGVSGFLGDVWVLTNANGLGGTPTWSQSVLSSTDFPAARAGHTAVYNPSTNKTTIFGGQIGVSGSKSLYANDVWVLNDANGQ